MPATEALQELAAELEAVAERLSDQAMDVLREALSEPDGSAPLEARATERLLNRARSSVEKAARLVRQAAGAGGSAGSAGSTDGELAADEFA